MPHKRDSLFHGVRCVCLCIAWASLAATANADTITLPSLRGGADLQLNGTAHGVTTSDGQVLRLANAQDSYDSGSAFTKTRIPVSTFSTDFTFRITDTSGADGLAFVLQSGSSESLGQLGG
jgi:hypothetical protein